MTADVAVSLRDVTFTYAGASRPALRDVSLEVRRGELAVILGASGAGKSTLVKCITRVVPAFQSGALRGAVGIAGRWLDDQGVAELAGTVGFVAQDFETQLFATTAAHEVAYGLEQFAVPRAAMLDRVRDALAAVGLAGFEARDPAALSGGEKQRLAIAAMLALEPAILVLDEPTTDLDPVGAGEVLDVLEQLRHDGRSIVLVEHQTAAAARADQVVVLAEGAVVARGRPAEVLAHAEALRGWGVRPRDVERLAAGLGEPGWVPSLDAAAALLQTRAPGAWREPPAAVAATGEALLQLEEVGFAYDGGPPVVADITLRLAAGEFVALIGQNGSGKTTLAKHLNGLLHPTRGRVRLRGTDLATMPLAAVAREIGYVFQNPDQQLFAPTVREEVTFALRNFGVPEAEAQARMAEALAAVELTGQEDADPFVLGRGERQRVAVASLLALRPSVLILDEPTTGLDDPQQRRMLELLARLHRDGMTVVVITHTPWVVAEYAQRGIVLRDGRVRFDGPVRALFAEPDRLRECRFEVPEVTRLGARFGQVWLSVDECLAAVTGSGR